MYRFLIASTSVIVLVATATFYFLSRERAEQAQDNGLNPSQQESQILPEPLRPPLPDIAQIPNNSCSKLVIPQEIVKRVPQLQDKIAQATKRSQRIHTTLPPPLEIERGNPGRKAVALTIDTGTGGNQGVPELLAIAGHYGIPLTFFLTGCWIVENPELTQRIVREGHTIANHTLTHKNLAKATDADAEREIAETDRLIKEATGTTPILFRKPLYAGGQRITELAGSFGKISILGYPDLGDTTGWREGVTAEDVRELVQRKTLPGAIWVFHNLSLADLHAFEDVIRFHLTEGYAIVSVEELLLGL